MAISLCRMDDLLLDFWATPPFLSPSVSAPCLFTVHFADVCPLPVPQDSVLGALFFFKFTLKKFYLSLNEG